MENNYRIDEGHVFSLEEEIFNIKWKVRELIDDAWRNEDILGFRDDEAWQKYAPAFISIYKKEEDWVEYQKYSTWLYPSNNCTLWN